MSLKIAIDIGNSRTKLGLFEGKELLHFHNLANEELAINNQLFSSYPAITAILSSVNKSAEEFLQLDPSIKLLRLSHQSKLPFKLEYQSPDTLGRDRMAAVAGAKGIFPNKNILVIDAGTCITYDFLTSDGRYLGGAISPGVQMRLQAMHEFTNKLPLISWDFEKRPASIGNTTISSMLSGVINGLLGEINGFLVDYNKHYSDLQIVITGGDAQFFEKELKNSIFADPNLVLKGLNEILDINS